MGYSVTDAVKCLTKITVSLNIRQDKICDYESFEKAKIQNEVYNWFIVDDSLLEVPELTNELKEKFHLYISEEDEQKVVLIEDR